jgi:uncharacterized membrane protein
MMSTTSIAPWRRSLSRAITSFADWLIDHWLGILNWALGTIVIGAILVPILAYLGIEPLAGTLFTWYHSICEQIPAHAFFIFGHQMAMCARNFSLYASLWAGSIVFRFVRDRIRPLDWKLAVLLMLPMALDGGTQLFGWRESNDLLRVITGTLFGLGVCWLALPFVEEAKRDTATFSGRHLAAQG